MLELETLLTTLVLQESLHPLPLALDLGLEMHLEYSVGVFPCLKTSLAHVEVLTFLALISNPLNGQLMAQITLDTRMEHLLLGTLRLLPKHWGGLAIATVTCY